MKKRRLTEIIGWYGFTAILSAYVASNLEWIAFGSTAYQMLNLTGAAALLIDAWPDRNWQVIFLNGIWAFVAIIAVVQ